MPNKKDLYLAIEFVKQLGKYRSLLPLQLLRTLKGQALSGDLKGAQAGLKTAASKYMMPKRG